MNGKDLVFISYAREDRAWAERLYMDLRRNEINAWLDARCLSAGSNWKYEIPKAIRESRYFLLLLSNHSINKRGYVQKEIKEGLDVLSEFPTNGIFIIPARLDGSIPIDRELQSLNWVDLLPDYGAGLARILSVLSEISRAPLTFASAPASPTLPVEIVDKGEVKIVEHPLTIGDRAAVSYAPFRTKAEFLQQFFDRLPTDNTLADRNLSYYVTLSTRNRDLLLGEDLLARYPDQITLVFHNVFRSLTVRNNGVSAQLSFNGAFRLVALPFDAMTEISIPEIGVSIHLNSADLEKRRWINPEL